MKDRTILQTITDTLEAAGIGVSGIETWPPEDDGRVSVSMTIRFRPEPVGTKFDCLAPHDKTDATLDAINANKSPDDPPAVRDPCGECAGSDCENCQAKNGTPIKLYDPKEAAAAMLAGRILRNEKGGKFFWKDDGFHYEENGRAGFMDLSGLYEEARYV